MRIRSFPFINASRARNPIAGKQGFTLIELLVVISIIALLIGILLPALGAARDRGRQTQCAANVSGIGKAYETHANDFRDAYPLAGPAIPWGSDPKPWMEQLSYYFTDPRGFQCPSFPIANMPYNYFMGSRAAYIATGGPAAINRKYIRYTSFLVTSGDYNYDNFNADDADPDDYTQNCIEFEYQFASNWKPHHQSSLNVLFADAHVATLSEFKPGEVTFRYATMEPWAN
jgi:prepilin-type N-terminal cleavage/methylation domain-containing protein/prepilin-type processing-associated H-X9-DG protein